MAAMEDAQVLMAVGTTVAGLSDRRRIPHAREFGARVAFVNDQPTPMDEHADAVIRTPMGAALPTMGGV